MFVMNGLRIFTKDRWSSIILILRQNCCCCSESYVNEQIEAFLVEMADILENMTDEDFETLVSTVKNSNRLSLKLFSKNLHRFVFYVDMLYALQLFGNT